VRLLSAEGFFSPRDDKPEALTVSARALVFAEGSDSTHSFSVALSAFVEVDKQEARPVAFELSRDLQFCVAARLTPIADDKPEEQRDSYYFAR
jgi:hypothetical protein